MKTKITLVFTILSLILVSGFLVYKQEVLAGYLAKKTAKPAIVFEDYSKMEKKGIEPPL
jgi:hypothetical protein